MAYSGEGNLIEGQVEGDPNRTVVPVAVDSDGHLIIDLDASTITIGTVQIEGPSGDKAKVDAEGDLQVDVNNFPATQVVTEANVDKNFGTWSYYAGVSGTVVVTAGQRVLGISAHATTAATVTINGGATITLPAGVSWSLEPLGNLVAPTVIFTGTDTYFIEVVS